MKHLIYYIFNHWEYFIPFLLNAGGSGATTVNQLSGSQAGSQLNVAGTNANNLNQQLQSILGSYQGSSGGSNAAVNNIATTGGYTPTQISAQQDQAAQASQSAYQTAGESYNRASAATGGYGPSGAASTSLARQGSNAATSATQGVLSTISQNQVGNQLAAAGLNTQQIQGILNTILGNFSSLNSAQNQTLATQAGLNETVAPGVSGASSIIQAINPFG